MTNQEFKNIRHELALSQVRMASAIGMSRPQISRYENGSAVIPYLVTRAIDCLLYEALIAVPGHGIE